MCITFNSKNISASFLDSNKGEIFTANKKKINTKLRSGV